MKSPITGKEMSLQKEERTLEFRKEEFKVMFHYYLCSDSGEQFTSTELDEINMNQVYNQYRDKHNLPFPEEVQEIREKYGLAATKMSEVLGFGVNSYRNYENGEVPSNANGKLLQLANDPKKFRQLVELTETLEKTNKEELLLKIDKLILDANSFNLELEDYLLDAKLPDEYSGYKKPNFKKLAEMVVFFTEQMQPWKTQMNKLLFYADFSAFKKTCFSISGTQYRAIQMGPVPKNYHSVFEYLAKEDFVDVWETTLSADAVGEQFKPHVGRSFNKSIFSDLELETLKEVVIKFKGKKTKDFVDISHKEKGWIENEKSKNLISYKYAFDLQF
jgi:putative zinc finger/helix-turn-helix YgiT family protein